MAGVAEVCCSQCTTLLCGLEKWGCALEEPAWELLGGVS